MIQKLIAWFPVLMIRWIQMGAELVRREFRVLPSLWRLAGASYIRGALIRQQRPLFDLHNRPT